MRDALRRLLFSVDKEFHPPLSARRTPVDLTLTPLPTASADPPGEPWSYWRGVAQQSGVVLAEGDEPLGFLAFRPAEHLPTLGRTVAAHVTTIVVRHDRRGHRPAGRIYGHLLRLLATTPGASVATRTWTANTPHLHVLARLRFAEVHRILDARGPGQDTIYFERLAADPPREGP